MTRILPAVVLMFVADVSVEPGASRQKGGAAVKCEAPTRVAELPSAPEASGVAVSRSVPGRLWTHNDSGKPELIALDERGKVTATLSLADAKVEDWEAVAVGRCPAGSCIYIADIGDNEGSRRGITVYRVTEPQSAATTARAEACHATYPDGARDAEALLVTPEGRLYVVSKGDAEAVSLYRFPADLKPGDSHTLEPVGKPATDGKASADDRITDGAVSPDGRWVALRTNRYVTFYPAESFLNGNWQSAERVDLSAANEPQGEGIAFGPNNVVYLTSEGGGKSRPGMLARMTCAAR